MLHQAPRPIVACEVPIQPLVVIKSQKVDVAETIVARVLPCRRAQGFEIRVHTMVRCLDDFRAAGLPFGAPLGCSKTELRTAHG